MLRSSFMMDEATHLFLRPSPGRFAPVGVQSLKHLDSALGFLATALLAGCGRPPARGAPPPPEVSVVTVAQQSVPVSYEFSGQVVPYRRVEVRARVDGTILERPFTEGQLVKQGTVLYKLDPVKYEAAFHSAEAR